MKKLISSALALTMLATPLMGSACFADTAQEPNVHYVQNENRSEPFKEKKCDSQKTRKILAGVAAGTIALTGVTAATLKLCENQLPENLKSKLPFLFTKKTQENIKTEKIPETVTEDETTKDKNIENETIEAVTAESEVAKNQTVETVAVDSNITKNETIEAAVADPSVAKNQTVETVTADSNITKNETIETLTVDSNITKNETIEPITTEPSISMNKTIETVATESNITKNETTIETIAAELNITKKENTGSVAVNSNTTKNETADIEAIKAKIIQSLAKNNTTNNTNDTNWLSTMKSTLENTGNSAKEPSPLELAIAKYIVGGLVVAAGSTLLFFAGHRVQRAFANLFNKPATNAAKRTAKNAVVRRTAKRITY